MYQISRSIYRELEAEIIEGRRVGQRPDQPPARPAWRVKPPSSG